MRSAIIQMFVVAMTVFCSNSMPSGAQRSGARLRQPAELQSQLAAYQYSLSNRRRQLRHRFRNDLRQLKRNRGSVGGLSQFGGGGHFPLNQLYQQGNLGYGGFGSQTQLGQYALGGLNGGSLTNLGGVDRSGQVSLAGLRGFNHGNFLAPDLGDLGQSRVNQESFLGPGLGGLGESGVIQGSPGRAGNLDQANRGEISDQNQGNLGKISDGLNLGSSGSGGNRGLSNLQGAGIPLNHGSPIGLHGISGLRGGLGQGIQQQPLRGFDQFSGSRGLAAGQGNFGGFNQAALANSSPLGFGADIGRRSRRRRPDNPFFQIGAPGGVPRSRGNGPLGILKTLLGAASGSGGVPPTGLSPRSVAPSKDDGDDDNNGGKDGGKDADKEADKDGD